mgnify:CR=1 FL=1
MVLDEGEGSGGLTEVVNDGRGAALDGSGLTILVVLALAKPLTEFGAGLNGDERDLVHLGEGSDELLVLGIFAVVGEDAQVSLVGIEMLADLVEALDNTY